MENSTTPSIEVSNLVKRYGPVLALDELTFAVQPGEVFGLLGPNGAGKTSTLEILVGLRAQDAGETRVLGLSLPRERVRLKHLIGVQLQNAALPRYLNAREVLELQAAFYPLTQPVDAVLAQFGFEDEKQQRTLSRYLSAGQQRRLAIAAATLHEPEALFLDEPTAGLDPQARRMVWELIGQRKREGKVTFLTTHDMHEAERVCDRVAIVDHGHVLAIGSPRELAHAATAEHAIQVQTNGWIVSGDQLAKLPGVSRVRQDEDGFLLYSAQVPRTLAGLMELQGSDCEFESIQIRPPSLEDLFLKLTGRRIRP